MREHLGSSLRVGTYNAKFLPGLPSNGARARILASRILEGDYDLIALNEVFSRRARAALVRRLSPHFPHNVQYVGRHHRLRVSSGLMVFSRLPLADPPVSAAHIPPRLVATNDGRTTEWTGVRFLEYDRCARSDCLAGKGAVYVRVNVNGDPLHVFVTHLQATYPRESLSKQRRTVCARKTQVAQLASFIQEMLGPACAERDNLLLLGDLNVDGGGSAQLRRPVTETNGEEWHSMLEVLGERIPGDLVDLWHRYAPPEDRGLTFPLPNMKTRVDYILLRVPWAADGLRVQHVTVAHNLQSSASSGEDETAAWGGVLSDHLGVNADLNRAAAGCNPIEAFDLVGPYDDGPRRLRIGHPGGMHWFRVAQPGKLVIGLDRASHRSGLRACVYAPTDISRPVAGEPAHHGVWPDGVVRAFAVGKGHYVRVAHCERSWMGSYRLFVGEDGASSH